MSLENKGRTKKKSLERESSLPPGSWNDPRLEPFATQKDADEFNQLYEKALRKTKEGAAVAEVRSIGDRITPRPSATIKPAHQKDNNSPKG